MWYAFQYTAPHKVALSVPFARTALSTRASFEVRSPKLLSVRFEQGSVATPQLLEGVELPRSISVMGQTVDLTPLQVGLPEETTRKCRILCLSCFNYPYMDVQ